MNYSEEEMRAEVGRELVSDDERVEIFMLTIENDRDILLKSIEGVLKTKYPFKLSIYENSLNSMNTAKIWNKLIRQSSCGYVMLMDSDAFPQDKTDWLEELVNVLKKNPDCAAVAPTQEFKDASEEQVPEHLYGFCLLFRKSIFDDIGFFDEDFFFYGQDSDWHERVIEDGRFKLLLCHRSMVKHGMGGEASISSKRLSDKNKMNRVADSEYAQRLFKQKKDARLLRAI